ncbi:hypothetical protein ACFXA3_39285, partial [Streptomyces sp. NPDC059456]|uniref:hypothetical protein n=1 Tax=Streptomyces sp. NPDC059456 TaxID=3346838 RepID=UPI0036944A1B
RAPPRARPRARPAARARDRARRRASASAGAPPPGGAPGRPAPRAASPVLISPNSPSGLVRMSRALATSATVRSCRQLDAAEDGTPP